MELARVIARASTTIPMRSWSADPESAALEGAVTSIDTGGGSGHGEGDDERADFFPVFLRGSELDCSSSLMSVEKSGGIVSSLDFLEALPSTSPIDRRFAGGLASLQGVSRSVRSDSGVDSLVSSSRIGDEERHVKGEEGREGDGERGLECDLVRDVDRFGVRGTDKAGLGMTRDGRLASGAVGTGSSLQMSRMWACSEGMSSS